MASEHIPTTHREPDRQPLSTFRLLIVILLALVALGYAVGIVLGYLPEGRRIDGPSLAVIAGVLLATLVAVRPDLVDRFKGFEMSGFKVEMLERVRERQAEQAIQLRDLSDMLPLLLPPSERKHLLNLALNGGSNYKGSHALRSELRRLRSFELIKMRPDKHVGFMKNGMIFDLRDYVELTDLGKRWSKRITEIDRAEPEAETSAQSADSTNTNA
jgi:hypothetical protein